MSEDRIVYVGPNGNTKVVCFDEPGAGGACHEYGVFVNENEDANECQNLTTVEFQKDVVSENGINGCTNEDLLAIIIDRMQHFQTGNFSCRENALALTKLEEALHWLRHRTDARIKRGVEGKNIV